MTINRINTHMLKEHKVCRPLFSKLTPKLLSLAVLSAVLLPASLVFGKGWDDFPKDEWPTFGGDYAQTRFSRLAQINKGNVDRLELKWVFSTGLDTTDPFYTFSPVPLVVGGVMYLSDPGNYFLDFQTAFALDAATGSVIWSTQLPVGFVPEARGQQNIRSTRGVAFGNNRIYVATQDATIWALDSATGQIIVSFGASGATVVGDVDAGYYLTSPPIFVPAEMVPEGGPASGRNLLLIGIAGGENESRGFFSAYDADSGDLIWRFFTVPSPGEFGGDTWPTNSGTPFADPFQRGGANPWMPPAYDPELGLVIFGTGNAGPDLDGTHRAGKNLFAASVVALDVRTGQRRWHFQEVHHDLWDYDQAAPPLLFDIKGQGTSRKAVGAAGKTGWFYILNRMTGEPIIPCPEKPVPNNASNVIAPDGSPEQIYPTQPYCESDPFVPQGGRYLADGTYVAPIFTPPDFPTPGAFGPYLLPRVAPDFVPIVPVNEQLVEPGVVGGSDWGPTSFNPHLGLAYIGGNVQPMRLTADPESAPSPGVGFSGGWWSYTVEEIVGATGTFTAMDVRTGRIRWQVQTEGWEYPGSCATAGNLVFIGEYDDHLTDPALIESYFTAYDAQTGERLYRFRIPGDAAIVAPCVTYKIDGKQYIAVSAGGSIGELQKGDEIFVFGLPNE